MILEMESYTKEEFFPCLPLSVLWITLGSPSSLREQSPTAPCRPHVVEFPSSDWGHNFYVGEPQSLKHAKTLHTEPYKTM